MPEYRIYWIGPDDLIRRADSVEFASDAEAERIAAEYKVAASAIEVWQGARRVLRLGSPEQPGGKLADGGRSSTS